MLISWRWRLTALLINRRPKARYGFLRSGKGSRRNMLVRTRLWLERSARGREIKHTEPSSKDRRKAGEKLPLQRVCECVKILCNLRESAGKFTTALGLGFPLVWKYSHAHYVSVRPPRQLLYPKSNFNSCVFSCSVLQSEFRATKAQVISVKK